uniref:AP-3 complex subunit mu-2 (Trinotate prediction) n=1 Tax=Myxobolus squamalis TaxID=59785 RepID=A0A6B2G5U7_MYXSQ
MIINRKNQVVSAEIIGRIMAYVNHSGVPKISASFSRATPLFKSVSFHPCVNMPRFNVDKVLEFVPPNGSFELMAYTCKITGNCLPFVVTTNQDLSDIFQFNISVAPSCSLKKIVRF